MTATPAPLVEFDYDSIPIGYYDEIFRRNKGIQSKWHHLKFARVRAELPRTGRILDVACGPGTFVGTLPHDLDCVGLDIAAAQIDYARSHYAAANHTFGLMDPGRLPLETDSFNIVTIVELIEHIPASEALQLLVECRRVLRPGGKLVVTTPNYSGLWPLLEFITNRLGQVSYEDQHITKYRPRRLQELLAASGLVGGHVETCLFSAPFFAALSWSAADFVSKHEPALLARQLGHLLIGTAVKQ
jgi:SAM-dependent methyltransferase